MQTRVPPRIAYLSGPVDAVGVYDAWRQRDQLGYFGNSHLTDFYTLCHNLGAEAYVITTLPDGPYRRHFEKVTIENRPVPSDEKGIAFHLACCVYLLRLLPHLIRFKPDVLVLTALQNYWFLLGILRLWQVALIPILTCTLWPQFRPLRPSWRILLRLNSYFFSHCVLATTVASEAIAGQIRDFASKPPPIDIFLPTYSPDQFSPIPAANAQARPFRIFFAGRIEANKGVYDILKIAERLRRDQVLSFHFDICGDGSELDSLRRRIADRGLGGVISCHGFCQREKLSSLLGQSHVVMVPTTSDFEEGFNMVCAEAVLAERPVVTSAVCPALYYVAAAAIEVAPDDADGYGDAIVRLSIDHELYESKRRACKPLQEQFYDVRNSWGARLQDVLENHLSWQFDQHANYGTGPENIRSH